MFSENLKAMRKAKGYTQEELAIMLCGQKKLCSASGIACLMKSSGRLL